MMVSFGVRKGWSLFLFPTTGTAVSFSGSFRRLVAAPVSFKPRANLPFREAPEASPPRTDRRSFFLSPNGLGSYGPPPRQARADLFSSDDPRMEAPLFSDQG